MSTDERGIPNVARRIISALRPALEVGDDLTVGELRHRLSSPDGPSSVVIADDHGPRVVDALVALRSELDDDAPVTHLRCCEPSVHTITDDIAELLSAVVNRPRAHQGHDVLFTTEWGPKLLAMPVVTALLAETNDAVRQIDLLTGLPGRATVQTALQEALRRDPHRVAVAFIDLDRFKEVNDLHGHAVGDRVLEVVGRRLRDGVRRGDIIGRIGGDEFVAVMMVDDPSDARVAAERLVEHIGEPIPQTTSVVSVGMSVGVALADGEEPDEAQRLIADADVLMFLAKQRGGGVLVAGDADQLVVTRGQLATALERNALELQYQPIVPLDGSPAIAVEALVRWPLPGGGYLPPSAFVPLAEATGQIVDLDWWALETAVGQVTAWDGSDRNAPHQVHVNLSALTLAMPGLVSHVERLLAMAGVSPARLTVEVAETAVAADVTRARDVLTALHALGVRTAIDDFGIGRSSLGHLSSLPVTALKIDREFVERLTTRAVDRGVVRVIRALADELGLAVIAEGVESLKQARWLRDLGITHAQGWLWAPALDARTLGDDTDRPRPEAVDPTADTTAVDQTSDELDAIAAAAAAAAAAAMVPPPPASGDPAPPSDASGRATEAGPTADLAGQTDG